MIKAASVEVNGGCNLACPVCPQAKGREKEFLRKMPLDIFESICDQLVDNGCEDINLQGSGEPTLNNDLYKYVTIARQRKMGCHIVTNGQRLDGKMMKTLSAADITSVRISIIGYNKETYEKQMKRASYDICLKNLEECVQVNSDVISSYHLVVNNENIDFEVSEYKKNFIEKFNLKAEIWKAHNWAGQYLNAPERSKSSLKKRSCGRPSAPYINIRAGGLDNHRAAVVPCCYVLGMDSEGVLGHIDNKSINEVWNSDSYNSLRKAHKEGRFEDISYCKNCDQLYDAPDSLIWTNVPGKIYGQHKNKQDLDYRNYK